MFPLVEPRQRPERFLLNRFSPLAENAAFLGLGGMGCFGSAIYPDATQLLGRNPSHGTLTNMDPATDWVWSPELGRWAVAFDGNNQEIPIAGTGGILNGVSVLSVAGWVNPATQATQGNPAWINNGHLNPFDCLFAFNGTRLYVYINSASRLGGAGYATVTRDVWTHIAVTWDGATIRVYLNGVHQSSLDGSYSTALNNTTNLIYLGDKANGEARGYIGSTGDTLLWKNKVLSLGEIAALADPSNVMLEVGGVPLILPPHRVSFPAAVAEPVLTYRNYILGGGVF